MDARRITAGAGTLLLSLFAAFSAWGKAEQANDFQWQGVGRIIAIGDLHGDHEQYRKVLLDAGLIDRRGKWIGEDAHLVQTGDITDRGPDSIAIIEHLEELKKQAQRKGGRVHTLIGNHEAMNSYGDLRYVHAGEFEHFVDRNSKALRERQWEYTLQQLESSRPEDFAALDLAQYRLQWEQNYPLGWVEHRTAWIPSGEFGQWMLGNPVAVQINDTIFLHGGLSAKYCRMSLAEITARAHAELQSFDPQNPGMIEDPDGPLWYRGLAQDSEESLRPVVDAILDRYQAGRIVIGHTPTGGVVWPRFEGRVVANDTGIAEYYGGHEAFLEITGDEVLAGYGGQRIPLPSGQQPREDYLRAVMVIQPGNKVLERRLEALLAPVAVSVGMGMEPVEAPGEQSPPAPAPFNPDICQ